MPVDRAAARDAIDAFLRALGRDAASEPELRHTGERVAAAWADELIDGYDVDVAALLASEASPVAVDVVPSAAPRASALVAVHGMAVSTMCPHHLLPARGKASVVYLPGTHLTGLGTLARVVDAFAHRLALQEVTTSAIAEALVAHLGARGAACRLELSHTCLSARGERQDAATVHTMAFAGSFAEHGADRDLALTALAPVQA
jgi:GTP cyclohydrolase I